MKSNSKSSRTVLIIIEMLLCLPNGILIGMIAVESDYNIALTYVYFVIGLAIALFLQTAIHEAGHLVFGLLTGFRFLSYRILSFLFTAENGRLKVSRYSIAGTLGQCLMSAPEGTDSKQYFLYNAGGVIFNIISTLLCYLLTFTVSATWLKILFACNAMFSLVMAFSNGFPSEAAGVANDGKNIQEMKNHPVSIDSFYNELILNEKMMKGLRPKDIPDELLNVSDEALKTGSIGFDNFINYIARLLDREEYDEAEREIDEKLDNDYPMTNYQRYALLCEQHYLRLLKGRNELNRDKELDRFIKVSVSSNPAMVRVMYTEALFRKDMQEAEKYFEQFKKVTKDYPYQGNIEAELQLIEKARNTLLQA